MQNNELLYKNRDWLFHQLIDLKKTPKQVAEEFEYSYWSIIEWANKRHHIIIQQETRKTLLTSEQKQVVIGSLLGDGHVTKNGRYTECHSANQKDYLEWKLSILKNLFTYNYTVRLREKASSRVICGVPCRAQDTYSISSRCNDECLTLSRLSKIELIDLLQPLGFAVFCLDDGSNHYREGVRRSSSQWTLGTCSFSEEEAAFLVDTIKNKFGINCVWEYSKDHNVVDIRVRFKKAESEQLNELIRQNIPNDLQILKNKHII